MTTFYDVPANYLIPALAEQLKSNAAISMPDWADVVKTGSSRERPPTQTDWWQTRAAALLRKIARQGPIGVTALSQEYGGRKNNGSKPNTPGVGSRKVIRAIVQQLEEQASSPLNQVAWLNQKVVKQHNCSTDVSSQPLDTNSSMKSHTVFDHKLKKPIQASTSTEWMWKFDNCCRWFDGTWSVPSTSTDGTPATTEQQAKQQAAAEANRMYKRKNSKHSIKQWRRFSPEARSRLTNISLVDSNKADLMKRQLVSLHEQQKISIPVNDEQLKRILASLSKSRRDASIRRM